MIRPGSIARARLAAGGAVALMLAGTVAAGTPLAGTVAAGTVAAGTLSAWTVAAGPPLAASKPSWTLRLAIQYLQRRRVDHSLYEVVIVEPKETWFLGGSNLAGPGAPEVVRRTGGQWHLSVPLPSGLHSWIGAASAQSPDNIWAVTHLGGIVLNWNGSKWRSEPKGGWAADTQFTGITAVSTSSVWLFGASGRNSPGSGTWHWNGAGWTQVKGIAGGIDQASAASPTDIWAIGGIGGSMNALLRLSGTAWKHVTPSALAGFSYSHVLAFAPGNVWVAGSVAGAPKLAHYDGHSWTGLTMPGTVPATGICRDGKGGLWVVANSGRGPSVLRERSALGRWTTATVSSSSADEVMDCARVPGTTAVWGAGKSTARPGTAAAVYGFGNLP